MEKIQSNRPVRPEKLAAALKRNMARRKATARPATDRAAPPAMDVKRAGKDGAA